MVANNPGSTVLPVQILPQGLIQLPPGAKVVYNRAPTATSSSCAPNSTGLLRAVRPQNPINQSTSTPNLRPTNQIRAPLMVSHGGKRFVYLPSPRVSSPAASLASQPLLISQQRFQLSPSAPTRHPSPPVLRQFTVPTTMVSPRLLQPSPPASASSVPPLRVTRNLSDEN